MAKSKSVSAPEGLKRSINPKLNDVVERAPPAAGVISLSETEGEKVSSSLTVD